MGGSIFFNEMGLLNAVLRAVLLNELFLVILSSPNEITGNNLPRCGSGARSNMASVTANAAGSVSLTSIRAFTCSKPGTNDVIPLMARGKTFLQQVELMLTMRIIIISAYISILESIIIILLLIGGPLIML
jgi:hypothetical protein